MPAAVIQLMAVLGLALAQAGGAPADGGGQLACPPPPPPPAPLTTPHMPPAPQLPPCINPQTMIGACKKAVFDRYQQSVVVFNAAMQDYGRANRAYIDTLNTWMTASGHYGQCEVDRVNRVTEQLNHMVGH